MRIDLPKNLPSYGLTTSLTQPTIAEHLSSVASRRISTLPDTFERFREWSRAEGDLVSSLRFSQLITNFFARALEVESSGFSLGSDAF